MVRRRSTVRFRKGAQCDLSRDRNDLEPVSGFGVLLFAGRPWGAGRWAWWPAGGLVVAGRVEDQFAEEFAGGGADDADVQVLDQEQGVGSGVGPADADVVEAAAVAQGDVAVDVEFVGADPVVGAGDAVDGGPCAAP